MATKVESAQREAIKNELANNHDAAGVGRVLSSPEVTVDDMKGLTPDEKAKLRAAITTQKATIGDTTYNALESLLQEAEKNPPQANSVPEPQIDPKKTKKVPEAITVSAGAARTAVSTAFGSPGEVNYKEYLSTLRRAIAKVPGLEPGAQSDIGDAIYQSRTFNLAFISWLEGEAAQDTKSFDTRAVGSGTYPFWGERTTFASVEEKRKVINSMLKGLAEAVVKPEIQAGMIEKFLGEDFMKKALLTVGGVAAVGVIGAILVYQGGKWILSKTLGATGAAVAGAIATGVRKGWGGTKATVTTAAAGDGFKGRVARAVTGATAGLVIDLATGMPGVATISGGVAGAARGRPVFGGSPSTPGVAPTGSPTSPTAGPESTAAYRELDMTKPLEKAGFDGILRELYNQEVTQGTRPGPVLGNTDPVPKDFIDEVRAEADPARSAEYQNRVARFIETLGQKPASTGNSVKDRVALEPWQRNLELAIRGEKDPTRWGKLRGKPVSTASAGDLRTRVSQAGLDMKSEKFMVGSDTYEVNPTAKVPLEEIRDLEAQIEAKEGELPKLQTAKKALEARLRDEKEYTEATHTLKDIDAAIAKEEAELATARKEVSHIRTVHMTVTNYTGGPNTLNQATLDADQRFDAAEEKVRKLTWEVQALNTKKTNATTTKGTLEGKYNNINRELVIDATGTLNDSTTRQKLESKTPLNLGVKEQIRQVEAEVGRLHGEISTHMGTLHTLNSKIPNTWTKAGIYITMPDGSGIRVSTLTALLETLGKAMAKK